MSVFTRMSSEKRAKLLNEQRFTSSRKGEVGKRIVAAKMMATVAVPVHFQVHRVQAHGTQSWHRMQRFHKTVHTRTVKRLTPKEEILHCVPALIYIQASKTTSTKGTDLLKELTGTDTSRS
ncbi:unnamed protein product [Alternaria alternata]